MAKNLLTDITKTPHRGVDIMTSGVSLPEEASVGQVHYTSGDVFIYDGKTWTSTLSRTSSSFSGSGTTMPSTSSMPYTTSPSIVDWANSRLPHDNDMLYIRRKDGKLYYLKANDFGGSTRWEEIAGSSSLVVGKAAGKPTADDQVVVETVEEELPDFAYGWYQDPSANLYEYGSSGWIGVSTTLAKKLNKMTEDGKMEYLG